MLLRRPGLTALALGLVSATGFAPLGLWPVLLACLAGWLALVHAAPTLRAALWRGWVFGLGHFGLGNNWIQHAFTFQDKMPPALGYLAVVLVGVYLAVYPMMAAGLAWRYGRRGERPDMGYALIAAAAWIVTEWLRAGMFTGYPWNPLAAGWLPVIGVARIAAWTGTYALSGVTVLAAGAMLAAAHRQWRMPAALAALIVLAAASPLVHRPPAPDPHRLVRVVQPNIGQEHFGEPGYAERLFATELALSGMPGAKPRLVVWPEGMVPYYLEDGYPPDLYYQASPVVTRARIAQLLGPRDAALVSGNSLRFSADGRQLLGAGNSVFLVRPDGSLGGQRYDKAHLVPYGEYLPMHDVLGAIGLSKLTDDSIDFDSGPGPRAIPVPGFGSIGVQICYEIIFSGQVIDAAHRPDLLLNPSNDSWFGPWGPPEHLAQARLRAIEEGVAVLRATPTGISAVIAADGSLVASVPAGTAGAVEVAMPGRLPPTLFARIGNIAAFLIAFAMVLGAVALRRARG